MALRDTDKNLHRRWLPQTSGLGAERESPQDARNERTRTWTEGPGPRNEGKPHEKIYPSKPKFVD
jgi:hypothetical protein